MTSYAPPSREARVEDASFASAYGANGDSATFPSRELGRFACNAHAYGRACCGARSRAGREAVWRRSVTHGEQPIRRSVRQIRGESKARSGNRNPPPLGRLLRKERPINERISSVSGSR